MTNSLHRFGAAEDLKDDLIVFAMATKGQNDIGAPERLREFLRICARHDPVNMGDGKKGGLFRPSNRLSPLAHWRRIDHGSVTQIIEGVDQPTVVSAVYDRAESLAGCLEEVKAADLGLSVNVAALTEDAYQACTQIGIRPHAVEYSLGFLSRNGMLPQSSVLSLTTMCGHGMIATDFAQKMIEWTKTGRRAPAECSRYMSRFCVCGIFNPARAERILTRLANQSPQ